MDQETLYRLSCRAASDLLETLELGHLEAVEQPAAAIRYYLALAETVPAAALHGMASYHREQMEALAGVAENVAGVVGNVRRKLAPEVQGLDLNCHLLRHLLRADATSSAAAPDRTA